MSFQRIRIKISAAEGGRFCFYAYKKPLCGSAGRPEVAERSATERSNERIAKAGHSDRHAKHGGAAQISRQSFIQQKIFYIYPD